MPGLPRAEALVGSAGYETNHSQGGLDWICYDIYHDVVGKLPPRRWLTHSFWHIASARKHGIHSVWHSIWHASWHSKFIWHLFGILSGIYFDILSGIYSDISEIPSSVLSGICSNSLSAILFAILPDIYSDILSDMCSGPGPFHCCAHDMSGLGVLHCICRYRSSSSGPFISTSPHGGEDKEEE